jgi:hypothetical protein
MFDLVNTTLVLKGYGGGYFAQNTSQYLYLFKEEYIQRIWQWEDDLGNCKSLHHC